MDDEDEDEDEEDEPPRPKKKRGKQPKGKTRSRKSRKKEAEALKPQPGWKDFTEGKKLRRTLVDEYGEEKAPNVIETQEAEKEDVPATRHPRHDHTAPKTTRVRLRPSKTIGQHDIDYSRAKHLRDKWRADEKMVKAIEHLPRRRHTMTERILKRIMQAKKTLKL